MPNTATTSSSGGKGSHRAWFLVAKITRSTIPASARTPHKRVRPSGTLDGGSLLRSISASFRRIRSARFFERPLLRPTLVRTSLTACVLAFGHRSESEARVGSSKVRRSTRLSNRFLRILPIVHAWMIAERLGYWPAAGLLFPLRSKKKQKFRTRWR